MILSFIPILAAIPFGALEVFVMMQRFNRTRIVKLIDKFELTAGSV